MIDQQASHSSNQPWLSADEVSFVVDENKHKKSIIKAINLTLSLNEFVVILGPNGAGKSTLMRLLTGFYQPTSGHITLNQQPINQIPLNELAKSRSVMQQQTVINTQYLVYDVIMLGYTPQSSISYANTLDTNELDAYKLVERDKTIFDEIFDEIVAMTECTNLLDRDMQTLSGGEQQRVHLARSLLQIWHQLETPAGAGLFLDEPTSALDLHYQQHLLRLIKKLTKSRHLMACAILHDVNLAALFADRIVLLVDGEIVVDGKPNEVLTHPQFLHWYRLEAFLYSHPNYSEIMQIALAE